MCETFCYSHVGAKETNLITRPIKYDAVFQRLATTTTVPRKKLCCPAQFYGDGHMNSLHALSYVTQINFSLGIYVSQSSSKPQPTK